MWKSLTLYICVFQSVYYHNKTCEVVAMFENWTVGMWLGLIIGILAFVFVVIEFIDMIKSRKLSKETKLVLTILFLVFTLLTAIIYWVWKNI
jgi:hypothetical protein